MDILEALGLKPRQATPAPAAPSVMDKYAGLIGNANPPEDPNATDEIVVTGDGWKPRKPNFLHFLADVVNSHYGNGFLATQLLDRENVNGALKNYADNPLQAVKRLGRVAGRGPDAVKLYDQYKDNERADVLAQSQKESRDALIEARKNKGRDRIASIMGALNKDNYDKMRPIIQRYAQTYDLDPEEVPDKYDPDLITAYRMGGMTVDQQMDNERADTNTDSMIKNRAEVNAIRRASIEERRQYHGMTQAERVRHNKVGEGQRQTTIDAKKPRKINTPKGPGELSSKGFLKLDSDQSIWKRNGSKWVRVK